MRKFLSLTVGFATIAPVLGAQLTANLAGAATQVDRTIVTQGGPGGPAAPGNPDDPRYHATYGRFAGANGIVSLRIVTNIGTFGCTGTLLPNRRQILTAAHCITDGSSAVIASSIDVRFQGPDNLTAPFAATITVQNAGINPNPANMQVMPGYTGEVIDSRDLAVLTLPTEAPAFAEGVGLFNGTADQVLGQTVTFAGFGSTGTGTTGDIQPGFSNRRRFGFNRFEATCNTGGETCVSTGAEGIFIADFDNGSPAGGYNGDTMCTLFAPVPGNLQGQLCNKGINPLLDEVGIGRGDSGGSALLNGLIVGVASWGARIDNVYAFGGFGTISGHASVLDAANRAWLNSVITPANVVPEPGTYVLMVTGLAILGGVARRRRNAA